MTYFKSNYEPQDSPLGESFEIPFDNQQVRFGTTSECTLPAYGDLLTKAFLRTTLPAIYPPQTGTYVFPQTSTSFSGALLVQKNLTYVTADGAQLTANTDGSHFFSVGAEVILSGTAYSFFNLDGVYTISSIPTANSFVCSSGLAGISYNGKVSTTGIRAAPVVGYYSTQNLNLWAEIPVNLPYTAINGQITDPVVNLVPGETINIFKSSGQITGEHIVATSTANTFTVTDASITGSTTYVLVDIFGSIFTTIDGIVWTQRTSPFPYTYINDRGVAYGNGICIIMSQTGYTTSTDGITWSSIQPYPIPYPMYHSFYYIIYAAGLFVTVGHDILTSPDGVNWTQQTNPGGTWTCVTYGNGLFVATGAGIMTSPDGANWTIQSAPHNGYTIAYGNGIFVALDANLMTSTDGINWTSQTPPTGVGYVWLSVTYGDGIFVAVQNGGYEAVITSTNGIDWTPNYTPPTDQWAIVTYSSGKFIAGSFSSSIVSSDGGGSWTSSSVSGMILAVGGGAIQISLTISFVEQAIFITYDPLQNKFVFRSVVYPSITFANAQDAAFWGFDYLQGPSFPFVNGVLVSQWTLAQGGWVQGFLPPALSAYDDSVAHKLVKEARVLVGRQVIKRYTGEYMELVNDLTIPYENKAILKLMNGTLDFTQAVASREYYVNIPLGCDSLPLCALTRQQMSIEIDFEEYRNLSNDLNKGTGDFFDPNSYLTYNVSQNLLGGQPFNVLSTLSYQQYILLLTTNGTFVVYDTTKPIDDPGSYQVITAFAGQTSVFVNFVVLGNILYIQLLTGYIVSGLLDELIQGNVSSFISNNYLPMSISDTGPPTGTMVCDARYLYYAQTNVASNVFFVRYDTRTPFQALGGYTSFNFTSSINSNTTSVYQIFSTGVQLIALTNTPGEFYQLNLNGNFTSSWVSENYSFYGTQITEGVLIGSTIYFVLDATIILVWSNENFVQAVNTVYNSFFLFVPALTGGSPNGTDWAYKSSDLSSSFSWVAYGNGVWVSYNTSTQSFIKSYDTLSWTATQQTTVGAANHATVAYGNGVFVFALESNVATSSDGNTWTITTAPSAHFSLVAFGNGIFVTLDDSAGVSYISINGVVWTTGSNAAPFCNRISFANGFFVALNDFTGSNYVSSDGITWTAGSYSIPFIGYDPQFGYTFFSDPTAPVYGNGVFVVSDIQGIISSTDGVTWTRVRNVNQTGYCTMFDNTHTQIPVLPWDILGSGFKNLHAVGTTIYASSSNACVIAIDTTQNLKSQSAYQYYSSSTGNSPISFAGNVPSIFANGPRYVYMFTNDPSQTTTPTNAIRYDPYPVNPTLQASIIADYKILPPGTPKPTWAEIKYIQTQHVTAESFADLQILGPVKELIVTGTPTAANVYQYSNLDGAVSLTITGNEEIITPDVGTVTGLGVMAPFQTHTVLPVRNLSVIPFEIDPESPEPNGTINFSRLQYQNLSNGASVWALSYNILKIESGIGGLKFNSPY